MFKSFRRAELLRWSSGLKQGQKDLDDADDRGLVLLFIKDVGQQLFHGFLPVDTRQSDGEKDGSTAGSQRYSSQPSDLRQPQTIALW